jgi:hypothetical protein
LALEPARALAALADLVPVADARRELLAHVDAIAGACGPPNAAERDRLSDLANLLAAAQSGARVNPDKQVVKAGG